MTAGGTDRVEEICVNDNKTANDLTLFIIGLSFCAKDSYLCHRFIFNSILHAT